MFFFVLFRRKGEAVQRIASCGFEIRNFSKWQRLGFTWTAAATTLIQKSSVCKIEGDIASIPVSFFNHFLYLRSIFSAATGIIAYRLPFSDRSAAIWATRNVLNKIFLLLFFPPQHSKPPGSPNGNSRPPRMVRPTLRPPSSWASQEQQSVNNDHFPPL